jgi:hypothetical protein
VAVVAPEQVTAFQALVDEPTWVIGEIAAGDRQVILQ